MKPTLPATPITFITTRSNTVWPDLLWIGLTPALAAMCKPVFMRWTGEAIRSASKASGMSRADDAMSGYAALTRPTELLLRPRRPKRRHGRLRRKAQSRVQESVSASQHGNTKGAPAPFFMALPPSGNASAQCLHGPLPRPPPAHRTNPPHRPSAPRPHVIDATRREKDSPPLEFDSEPP